MYVAAHRVCRRTGTEGVNVFLHLHGSNFPWPEDPSGLPETNPGGIQSDIVELEPGGNRVRSYLDVLAPDGTSSVRIHGVLVQVEKALGEMAAPTALQFGEVVVRFGVEQELMRKKRSEFRALRERVRLMLEQGRSTSSGQGRARQATR
jgi:hypothetical protein